MGKTVILLFILVFGSYALGDSAAKRVAAGNALYGEANFDEAIAEYDKAVEIDPEAFEAMFNKGAALFRKGEINPAIELFQDVAAGSGDKELVRKAKYNLGNSHFRRALEQPEPDMEKAMADYKSSVKNWRQVLDMDKSNPAAKRNVEIAKAAIRKLKEEQQKQQKQEGEDGQEDKEKQQQDQEKQEGDEDKEKQEEQQGDGEQDQQQEQQNAEDAKKDEKQKALDALAEDILKKEKEDRKKRQMLLLKREPVEKDW